MIAGMSEDQIIQQSLATERLTTAILSTVAIVAVIFTAFCIWLTVRILNRRERWAKWTLAGVVSVPVLYVASFGPACWYIASTGIRNKQVPLDPDGYIHRPKPWFDTVYLPIGVFVGQEPYYIRPAFCWYGMVGAPKGSEVFLPSNRAPFGSNAREGVGMSK